MSIELIIRSKDFIINKAHSLVKEISKNSELDIIGRYDTKWFKKIGILIEIYSTELIDDLSDCETSWDIKEDKKDNSLECRNCHRSFHLDDDLWKYDHK